MTDRIEHLLTLTDDPLLRGLLESARRGHTFHWKIDRDADDHDLTRTFSAAAMGQLRKHLSAFVAARVLAEWDRAGRPPKAMDITVTVTFRGPHVQ